MPNEVLGFGKATRTRRKEGFRTQNFQRKPIEGERSKARGPHGRQPIRPADHNSSQQLFMAKADHTTRPLVSERFVTVQQSRRFQASWHKPAHLRTEPPLYPWMKLAGRWVEHVGFEAGQRVKIVVERGKLTITAA